MVSRNRVRKRTENISDIAKYAPKTAQELSECGSKFFVDLGKRMGRVPQKTLVTPSAERELVKIRNRLVDLSKNKNLSAREEVSVNSEIERVNRFLKEHTKPEIK
ncbi:MAG: hypothetical protein V1911_02320 [Candidatus Micrarchaeota archaeon]